RCLTTVGETQPLPTLPSDLEPIAAIGSRFDGDVESRLPVPCARREVGSTEALRRGREVDRFEETRLARTITAKQQMRAVAGSERNVGEVAEGARGYGREQRIDRRGAGGGAP